MSSTPPSQSGRWRKPLRLYEEIAADLASAISEGRPKPGEFLPTEQALSEKYRASRTAIREALRVLNTRGMVEVMHGRGTRVLPRHRWQLLDQLVRLVCEDIEMDRSLFELRRILEIEGAGLAAERATAGQLRGLREAIRAGWECVERPEEWTTQDSTFHHLLAEASGNLLLPQVMESVAMLVRAAALSTARDPGATVNAMEKHEAILAKVEARDPAGARDAMRRHLLGVERRLLEKLETADRRSRRQVGTG
jgi:GntR family transcriptional regulator, transcriptional repressor for pyruvate dehydrogenase complex